MLSIGNDVSLTEDVADYEKSYTCRVRAHLEMYPDVTTFVPDTDPSFTIKDWCKGLTYSGSTLSLLPEVSVHEYTATGSREIRKHVLS